MDKNIRKQLDRIVWNLHLKNKRRPRQPIPSSTWKKYWKITRKECRGHWHGATGLIAERLKIGSDEWNKMVQLHQPKKATCLGDSSHDYSYMIEGDLKEK